APFTVGNDAPGFVGPVTAIGGPDRLTVTFTLKDSTSDVCSVKPTYAVGGGSPIAITSGFITAGAATTLSASPAGTTFNFTWNAASQDRRLGQNVTVQLTPNDDFADGVVASTLPFTAGTCWARLS